MVVGKDCQCRIWSAVDGKDTHNGGRATGGRGARGCGRSLCVESAKQKSCEGGGVRQDEELTSRRTRPPFAPGCARACAAGIRRQPQRRKSINATPNSPWTASTQTANRAPNARMAKLVKGSKQGASAVTEKRQSPRPNERERASGVSEVGSADSGADVPCIYPGRGHGAAPATDCGEQPPRAQCRRVAYV